MEPELDSLNPDYDGSKGRYYLSSLFGPDFCHGDMVRFDLPDCFADINWDDERSRLRWMNFCVAFLPEWIAGLEGMAREHPDESDALHQVIQFYEQRHVGLREAIRREDPQLFAHYHPNDAPPALLEEMEMRTLFSGLTDFVEDVPNWNRPGPDGQLEWRLGWLFWHDFEDERMTDFDLPPRYNDINWHAPQQTRNWMRFCLWFLPIAMDWAQQNVPSGTPPMPPDERKAVMQNFHNVFRSLDPYLPRADDETPLFND